MGDWEEGTGTEAEAAEAMAAATKEIAVMARRPPSSSGSSSSENDDDDDNGNDDSEVQEAAVKAVKATDAGEWLEYFDDDGNPYYCNETTGETVWEKPVQEATPQEASTDSGLPPAPPAPGT